MPPKGGIKRRLAEAAGSSNDPPVSGNEPPASSNEPPAPKRGIRKRVASASKSQTASVEDLPLVNDLRQDWGKGKITSEQVQRYCLRAHEQGAPGCEQLGSAGNRGKNPQHLQRALMNYFGTPTGSPEMTYVNLPLKGGKKLHPVYLPSKFFSALYHNNKDKWLQTVAGAAGAAEVYWSNMVDSEFFKKHPSLKRSNCAKAFPLGFHGDAGAFSNQDSLYTFSWNSLVASPTSTTRDGRFIFTVVKKEDITPETLDAILTIFAWDMNALQTGFTADKDWEGRPTGEKRTPIAGGFRGILTHIRGDWEFFGSALGLAKWNQSENMCPFCRASNMDCPLAWTDFSDTAPWRSTLWTHESWLAHLRFSGKKPSILFDIVGLRIECVMIDILHTVDQGVGSNIIGNVFWELVRDHAWVDTNQADNVAKLQELLNEWYRENPNKYKMQGKITLERLRTDGWPRLKAKAAATRHLAEFAWELAKKHDSNSTHDRMRTAVCQLLVEFYNILNTEGAFLSQDGKKRLSQCSVSLCKLYAKLSRASEESHVKSWKAQPKLHLFLHACQHQAPVYGNPRCCWTYSDEDLVGQMIEVARTCHPSTMSATALFKWVQLMF